MISNQNQALLNELKNRIKLARGFELIFCRIPSPGVQAELEEELHTYYSPEHWKSIAITQPIESLLEVLNPGRQSLKNLPKSTACGASVSENCNSQLSIHKKSVRSGDRINLRLSYCYYQFVKILLDNAGSL